MLLRRLSLPLLGAFLALYLIWGSTYLVIRIGVESWPPLLMAAARFLLAGALLYGWLRWRGTPAPNWTQWKSAGWIGILLLSCGNGGVTFAEHAGVASGIAALAVATVPLFTLLFGLFWGERNTRLEWLGIGMGLRDHNPAVKIVEAQPVVGHYIQGLKNMEEAIVPALYQPEAIDEHIMVESEIAFDYARQIVKKEGIFVGMSSGAAMYAAAEVAKTIDSGLIVVIFPDRGEKYLSTDLFKL